MGCFASKIDMLLTHYLQNICKNKRREIT